MTSTHLIAYYTSKRVLLTKCSSIYFLDIENMLCAVYHYCLVSSLGPVDKSESSSFVVALKLFKFFKYGLNKFKQNVNALRVAIGGIFVSLRAPS